MYLCSYMRVPYLYLKLEQRKKNEVKVKHKTFELY